MMFVPELIHMQSASCSAFVPRRVRTWRTMTLLAAMLSE